ncbi:MAG: glucose-1-phosphate cytidylyltransferase [Acidobacteriota bacterium]
MSHPGEWMEECPVVILCGGLGTRLREETEFRPKPLVEIGAMPILWHIMKMYAHYGFTSFILCLGYKGSMIKEFFLNYEHMANDFTLRLGLTREVVFHNPVSEKDWTVTFAETGYATNTGGRIKLAEKYIQTEHFLMTYGDGVADINIRDLVKFHLSHGKLATLTGVYPLSRFGVIELTEDGILVKRFREKPRLDGVVSGGFFVLHRQVFEYLDEGSVFEQEPLNRLAEDRQLAVYPHRGFWKSLDTYRDFLEFNRMWANKDTPWKVW